MCSYFLNVIRPQVGLDIDTCLLLKTDLTSLDTHWKFQFKIWNIKRSAAEQTLSSDAFAKPSTTLLETFIKEFCAQE